MSDTTAEVTSDLLNQLQSKENKDHLKDVTTTEGTGAAYNMTMYGIEKFNKEKLAHVEVTEKIVLPDSETIQKEKEELENEKK